MIFRGKLPDTVAAVPGCSSLVWYNHSIWLSGCQSFFCYFDVIFKYYLKSNLLHLLSAATFRYLTGSPSKINFA